MRLKSWHIYSLLALLFWGLWGFFSKVTADLVDPKVALLLGIAGNLIVAVFILFLLNFRLEYDGRGVIFAVLSGVSSIGSILLFLYALRYGKSVIVVPMTALYPAITVLLGYFFLEEELNRRQMTGIALAIVASVLLSL